MSTIWTNSTPADIGRPGVDHIPRDEFGEEGVLLFHDGVPDRLRIPDECPIHAGEERLVEDHPGGIVEILTRRPGHLGRWGFQTMAELQHGVTRMQMRLPMALPDGAPEVR